MYDCLVLQPSAVLPFIELKMWCPSAAAVQSTGQKAEAEALPSTD